MIKNRAYLKKIMIQCSGAFVFKRRLRDAKISHNAAFSGIYSFQEASQYPELFRSFLKNIPDGGLIMCHPGLKTLNSEEDSIFYSRPLEYDYFLSDRFLEDCQHSQITLKTFRELSYA
jgi:hypothetical protein